MSTSGDTRPFRQRLDDKLRQRDPVGVRDFLVAEGQWDEGRGGDLDFAMWMMIAGSPRLRDLHAEAEHWLRAHGHAAEADIIGGSRPRAQHGEGSGKQNARTQRPGGGQACRHGSAAFRGRQPGKPQHRDHRDRRDDRSR